jgi:hypothetical protein
MHHFCLNHHSHQRYCDYLHLINKKMRLVRSTKVQAHKCRQDDSGSNSGPWITKSVIFNHYTLHAFSKDVKMQHSITENPFLNVQTLESNMSSLTKPSWFSGTKVRAWKASMKQIIKCSVVEHLLIMHEALDSIPSTKKICVCMCSKTAYQWCMTDACKKCVISFVCIHAMIQCTHTVGVW